MQQFKIIHLLPLLFFLGISCEDDIQNPRNVDGCMELNACNYNENATVMINTECNYNLDCAGICGGNTVKDSCGICGGDNSSCSDCAGILNGSFTINLCGECVDENDFSCVQGCDGIWKNDDTALVDDDCGVCNGDNSTCTDCNGDINGTAYIDGCGICVGGKSDLEECPIDCNGVDGGSAWINPCGECVDENDFSCVQGCDGIWKNDDTALVDDDCGVCNGDNSSCLDCASVANGDNVEDECGTCDNDPSNDCIQDCSGTWGGELIEDECNVCGGDNSSCTDCNGSVNGDAFFDACGNCQETDIESWQIEIIAEIEYSIGNESYIVFDGSSNYLGASSTATDGFDGFDIDTIEPFCANNPNLSFSFYHDDWDEALIDGQQYSSFTSDIRYHSYEEFNFENKIWNAELKTCNIWYNGIAKLTFNFSSEISQANVQVDVIGSNLGGNSYTINNGGSIDNIFINFGQTVNFDITISNLCY